MFILLSQTPTWETHSFADRANDALQAGSLFGALGHLILAVILALVLVAGLGLVLIYAERKLAGHFQCRLGPMRVGWHGVLQPFADGIKLFLKEDIVPKRADKLLHTGAPLLSILATILALAIIPISPSFQLINVNIGVLYFIAVTGIGVLGILIAGWSSNNKWSLLGAMRAGAQIISYELSATLALLVVVLLAGSLKISDIIQSQMDGWWIWKAHIVGITAFFLFLIASTAELNRIPFDLPEGESELTGGFHTEYSGLRFAYFFLAEFVNMFVASAMVVTLFFGGWLPFYIGDWTAFNQIMAIIPPAIWFTVKTAFFIFLLMWFRWTLPRLRIDQLMRLEWKVLLPIGFANLFLGAFIVLVGLHF